MHANVLHKVLLYVRLSIQIKNLEGLSRFVALGSLLLANNNVAWKELLKIRHLHILEFSLHGNPELEKDPYCKCNRVGPLRNTGRNVQAVDLYHCYQQD